MSTNDPTRGQTLWLFDAPRYYDFTKSEEENNHMGDAWFDQQNTSSSFFPHRISNTTTTMTIDHQRPAALPKMNKHEDLETPLALRYHNPVNYTTDAYLHSPSQRRQRHSQNGSRRWDIKLELKKKTRHEQTQHLEEDNQQQDTITRLDDNQQPIEHWPHPSPTPTDITASFLYDNTIEQQRQHVQTLSLAPSSLTQEYTDQPYNQSPPPPDTQEYTDLQDNPSSSSPSPVTQEYTGMQDNQPSSPVAEEYTDQQQNLSPLPATQVEYTDQQSSHSVSNSDQEHTNTIMDKENGQGELEYRIVKLPILGITIKSPITKPNTPRRSELNLSSSSSSSYNNNNNNNNNNDTNTSSRYNPVSASPLRPDRTKPQKEQPDHSKETRLDETTATSTSTERTNVSLHQTPPSSDHAPSYDWVPSTSRKRPHSLEEDHQQIPPLKAAKLSSPESQPSSALLQLITRIKSHTPHCAPALTTNESPLLQLITRIKSSYHPSTAAWRKETLIERAKRVLHEAHIKSKKWIIPLQQQQRHRRRRLTTTHRLSIPHRPPRYLTPALDQKQQEEEEEEKEEKEELEQASLELRPNDHESWTTHPGNSFISPYLPVTLTVPRSPKFATDKRLKRY